MGVFFSWFPHPAFTRSRIFAGSKNVLDGSSWQAPTPRKLWNVEAVSSHSYATVCGDVTIAAWLSNGQVGWITFWHETSCSSCPSLVWPDWFRRLVLLLSKALFGVFASWFAPWSGLWISVWGRHTKHPVGYCSWSCAQPALTGAVLAWSCSLETRIHGLHGGLTGYLPIAC